MGIDPIMTGHDDLLIYLHSSAALSIQTRHLCYCPPVGQRSPGWAALRATFIEAACLHAVRREGSATQKRRARSQLDCW